MADRFVFDVRVFPQLMGHPRLAAVLREMADVAADGARSIAPVDEGDYIDSIDSTVLVDEGITKGVAFSDDPKAIHIEYGTVDTPTFAPLRRGLERLKGGF